MKKDLNIVSVTEFQNVCFLADRMFFASLFAFLLFLLYSEHYLIAILHRKARNELFLIGTIFLIYLLSKNGHFCCTISGCQSGRLNMHHGPRQTAFNPILIRLRGCVSCAQRKTLS